MSDTPPRVTRQMFIEEYARCLVERYKTYKNMDRLGKTLASITKALDNELNVVADEYYKNWVRRSEGMRDACEALGLGEPTLAKLRALPKE